MECLYTAIGSCIKYSVQDRAESPNPEFDYTVCHAEVLDDQYAQRLCGQGFRFHDRILFMEIPLRSVQPLDPPDPKLGIVLTCDRNFSEDVYQLAYKVYTTDRRFHLTPGFDQEAAIPYMQAYIDGCRDRGMKIFKALHGDELLGYAIVNEQADEKGQYFENMLGVTAPGIKGKMIATQLYTHMLVAESAGFRKYAGRVSASNLASINLHYQLGARTASIYDEYIYRK